MFAVPIVTDLDELTVIRSATSTSDGEYGGGGTKKSEVLVALPNGVATLIRPDVAVGDTEVDNDVVDAEDTRAWPTLKVTRSAMVVVSKFVPEIVTAVPGKPMVGFTLAIVGAPGPPTVNEEKLIAEPEGLVTEIVPVVAPAGTVVVILVVVLDWIVAVTPLNDTVFWLATALKPIPYNVTAVPTDPPFGVNSTIRTVPAV